MALPVAAQDEEPPAGAGEGGIILAATFTEPGTFNPFYCTSTSCVDDALTFMLPDLVGVDPSTATFVKGGDGALATDWTVSEDGTVYTFTLRDDIMWTDGTPVTAQDVEWSFRATIDPDAATPGAWISPDYVVDVKATDDYTVEVTFADAACGVVAFADYWDVVPSHVFADTPMAELEAHPYGTNPNVSAGVFQFGEYRPAEQFSLLANQDFPDTEYGYVVPAGRIVSQVPDQTVMIEQLLAGEINSLDSIPPDRRDDIFAAAEDGSLKVYEYPGNTWDYLGLNYADPTNPQSGEDENGEIVDQGVHPLFGDKRVRQAIARAIDVDAIVEGAVFGYGSRMTSVVTPGSWAYNQDLPPIAYDTDAALALLAEAGWVQNDEGMLVANEDALYVEPGTPFEFTLYTNEGNTRREAIGTVVQDQLSEIGMVVDFQTIEWNTLLEITDSQEYDAMIMGWRAGYPDDPGRSLAQIFTAANDVPGGSSNDISYYSAEMEDLLQQARTVEGCDPADQKPYYDQIQAIMQEDLPYIWLYSIDGMYVAGDEVENFSPYPAQMYWNIDAWAVNAD